MGKILDPKATQVACDFAYGRLKDVGTSNVQVNYSSLTDLGLNRYVYTNYQLQYSVINLATLGLLSVVYNLLGLILDSRD